ncbi:GlxA family transcriptional regulator [Pseudomonas sp. CMR5c]|uniref:GlxA family transcriptional regulator n=1 Tax=Pseudomonas sp. CMR5c TaxID=658630 RepID=UPI00069D86E9|nr:helix-turn-helix domain-containing protein [Pseudomonas sp. CMR5c]AZC18428.1 Transcriptional regulator, AraC family [Pseudomonas sp. CMR5c]
MPCAAILTFDGCYASSATGFADILQVANSHLRRQDDGLDSYTWHFVSRAGGSITTSNGLSLQTRKISSRSRYDLVFIPSIHYAGARAFDQLLEREQAVSAWLVRQWRGGAWIAANCTGTFLLAQSRLLDRRTATTTWWLERQFRECFPLVDLQPQPILTEAERLVCAGAQASYLLQAVRIIERFSGPLVSRQTARTMLIDVSQNSQAAFLPLLVAREHNDSLVSQAQQWLQNHMHREVRMSDMAQALCVSEKTIVRRFKAALESTPLNYLQNLRLDAAKVLLEQSDQNIDQVAVQVGYLDVSSFSRLFRERIGISPGSYRERFASGA